MSGSSGGGTTSRHHHHHHHRRAESSGGTSRHHKRHDSSSCCSSSSSHHQQELCCDSLDSRLVETDPHRHKHSRSKSGNQDSSQQLANRMEFRSQNNMSAQPTRPTSLFPANNDAVSRDSVNRGGSVQNDNWSSWNSGELLPEREPIQFECNLIGAPPEVEDLVENIKSVAEQFLYHWKTFPIILPSPVAQADTSTNVIQMSSTEGTLGRTRSSKYHLRDLFVTPSFDELDAVAVDGKGDTRKLTGKQLEHIRERGLHKDKYGKPKRLNCQQLDSIRWRGEFLVESLNFPGQQHKWKLSELLQKGTERTKESLLNDMALALRFLFVTAKNRISSPFFSVSESFKALLLGLLRILDVIVGIPSLQAHNLETKIREERSKYLVAELVCRPENEESLELFCSYVRKQLRRAATEKFEVSRECAQSPQSVPYRFLTPAGAELDLRLWDRSLIRAALPTLIAILERETRGWFLHFRERLIAELRAQKLPDDEIEKRVNEAVMHEYLQRVYNSILANADLAKLGEGVSQLLVHQAQSIVLMHRAVESVQRRLAQSQETVRQRIESSHPVLSRIGPWMRAKLHAAETKFGQEYQWNAHEEALALCQAQKLSETCYFLNRDLAFMKEREPALLRELSKDKTPTRSFLWPTQIWLPTNWIVRRNFQGHSEVVPTVLSSQATTITTPRSDPSQPVFLVEKELVRTTTTRWPLWRVFNYFHRTWCWTWNAMFFFGILIPWCSPLGFRALFYMEPFMPDLELSQINGTLFPRKSSLTSTLFSRLVSLWRHISKSRTHFETKPDTGFIGKGLTRHTNRVWNYFFKGLFGTIAIVFIFPLVALTAILASLFITVTAALWMPLVTLGVQIVNGLFYDLDSPEPSRNRFCVLLEALLCNILLQGCVQPILAIGVALFLCPAVSLIMSAGGLARYWSRLLWDTLIFHALIKKRGRIPSTDSFVVRRVAGPGLASDYYFQIAPEQALAAFEAKMEWDELSAYQSHIESIILQPQKDFSQFVEACFGNFSAQLAKNNGPYRQLEKEGQSLVAALHEKLERRRRDLQTGLNVAIKSKIKLATNELKIAIQQGALMLERFYPKHILPKLGCSEEQFWENRALSVGDWAGLASLLYTELFSLDILTPLDHTDTSFRLDPHPNADISRYTEMVHSAQLGAGPDLLGNVYTPRGNIQVHAPYLEVSAFNPRSKVSGSTAKKVTEKRAESQTTLSLNQKRRSFRMPWKNVCKPYAPDKLLIPLPVPHPTHIAVTIYNRDTENPIPLESELCQSILKSVEECHQSPDDAISRYRSGDTLLETASSSSEAADAATTANTTIDIAQREEGEDGVYRWTLSNWGNGNGGHHHQRKRNNSGSVRVDLASPEDVTLESDSSRVVFSTYGTTV